MWVKVFNGDPKPGRPRLYPCFPDRSTMLSSDPAPLFFQRELRRIRLGAAIAAILALTFQTIHAQSIPSGGASLTTVTDIAVAGSFYGGSNNGGPVATRTIVSVTGQSFAQAAEFNVQNPDGVFYSSAVTAQSNRAVAVGDVVLLHFYMRAIQTTAETGSVIAHVYVEGPSPNYTKSISAQVFAGTEWTEYFLPFTVVEAEASGDLGIKLGLGESDRPEILQVAGYQAIWYGTSRTLDEMPRTSFQYDGRDPNAAWRKDADARIEQYRKANYEVRVVNTAGVPVPGATVHMKMLRHAFQFGTAYVASRVADQSTTENQTYLQKLLELFNAGSTENALKWGAWDGEWGPSYNKTQTLAALSYLHDQGMHLRGHVLVWPSKRNLPASLGPLIDSADPSLPQLVLNHIDDIVGATKDYLEEWDVLNEPYDNHDLMDLFGQHIMVDWFAEARLNHPTARLFINDYGILSGGGVNITKQDAYANTIQYLLDNAAPVTGIGFQSHFDTSPTGIPKVWSVMQRYAQEFPDLPFRVTEFDVDTDDEQLQVDYTRDFMTIVFSEPKVIGFQMWGFWEGAIWRSRAAMYRQDWTEKPNGAAYRDLVFNKWWTDETRTTRTDGRVLGRGFLGDYSVEVTAGGQTVTQPLTLTTGGVSQDVTIDVPEPGEPQITRQPFGITVSPGETAQLTIEVAGDPAPEITWYKNGVAMNEHGTVLGITNAVSTDEARYYATVTNSAGTIQSREVRIGVRLPADRHEKLVNISTRGSVLTGDGVMIAGFVITGTGTKNVVLRGIGPRLASFGVPGVLANPRMEIFHLGEIVPFAENDTWDPALATVFSQVGAFDLTGDTASAALQLDLPPGGYTVKISGVNNTTGIGIVEAYDASTEAPLEFVNISTRGQVAADSGVLIAGFYISGEVPKKVLIRGVGPTLGAFGVSGTLADPTLKLFEQLAGGATRQIAFNDDWSLGNDPNEIAAASAAAGAFPLDPYSRDAAMVVWLEPGGYTVHLAGANGGTGVGLVEVYRLQ